MAGSPLHFLDRLFPARNPDGQAAGVEQTTLAEGRDAAGALAGAMPLAMVGRRGHRRPEMEPRRILLDSLARKTLHAWLQNRHQTLFPLTLNLRVLDSAARAALLRLVAAAAAASDPGGDAGGELAPAMRERILRAFETAGGSPAELARLLPEAMASPVPLATLLHEVQAAKLGAHAYAASLLALGRDGRVERAWLEFLAARFALPDEVTHSLDRRYRR